MSKRLIAIVIIIIVVVAVGSGCSGRLAKEDLLIRTDIVDIQLEETDISNTQKADLMEYGISVGKNTVGMGKSEKNVKLANGIGVGDSVKKVLSVFGKNLMYDEFKDENSYELVYYYYDSNGKLEGVSDKINFRNIQTMRLDDNEKENYEKIKSVLHSSDNYIVKFRIRDDVIENISLIYVKAPAE